MARLIKETPILTGKDVERFIYNMNNPKKVSKEEIERLKESYLKFKNMLKRNDLEITI